MRQRLFKRAAAIGSTVALAAAGLGFVAAGPASATATNIDAWHATYCLTESGDLYCLWYLEGQGTGGAGWGSSAEGTSTIASTFNIDGNPDNDGYGQLVRNNAESMSNGTYDCDVRTYVSPGYQGNDDWLEPEEGGNLSSGLINNEASIEIYDCT